MISAPQLEIKCLPGNLFFFRYYLTTCVFKQLKALIKKRASCLSYPNVHSVNGKKDGRKTGNNNQCACSICVRVRLCVFSCSNLP